MLKSPFRLFSKVKDRFLFINQFQDKFNDTKLVDKLVNRDFHEYLKNIDKFDRDQGLIDFSQLNQGMVVPLQDLLNRKSKLMRPLIINLASEILGIEKSDEVLLTCALVEVIHNVTLIIDDIQDKGLKRRGEECVHLRYGIDSSLTSSISNSYYIIRKYIELLNIDDPALKGQIMDKYFKCLEALFVGVCWDVQWHKELDINNMPSWHNFDYMIRLKTTRLLAFGVEMMALVFSKEIKQDDLKCLFTSLDNFGYAFQVNDDVINLASDEYAQLKSIGDDLIEKKMSYLIMKYGKESGVDLTRKREFVRVFNIEEKSESDIDFLIKELKTAGIIEEGFDLVNEYKNKSVDELLSHFGKDNREVGKLIDLYDYIIEGEFLINNNR